MSAGKGVIKKGVSRKRCHQKRCQQKRCQVPFFTTSYTYDRNGNLLSTTNGVANTWNYRNQLTQSVYNGTTLSYTYNQEKVPDTFSH